MHGIDAVGSCEKHLCLGHHVVLIFPKLVQLLLRGALPASAKDPACKFDTVGALWPMANGYDAQLWAESKRPVPY